MRNETLDLIVTEAFNVGEKDLAWLGGFWDADGSIGITKRRTYLVPFASCTNTNEALIKNVQRILDNAEIEYRLDYQDRGERKNAKPAWVVRMESKKRVYRFCQMIEPYLVGKRTQAQLVMEWCELPVRSGTARISKGNTEGYHEIADQIRELNHRGRVR